MVGVNKMNNKLILTLMLGILLIGIGSADTCLPNPIKINTEVTLFQSCPLCSYVNISNVQFPDGTITILNEEMSNDDVNYYYNFSDTSQIGTYYYTVKGDKSGVVESETICFEVTTGGLKQTTSNSIGSLAFLFLMITLMIIFGIVGFRLLKHQTLWILGTFLIFFAILLMIYNTWLGYEYHRLFTGLSDSSMPEIIFYTFMLILILGLLSAITLLILNWKKVFKYIKKELKRKEDSEDKDVEDWDFDYYKGKDYGS